MKKAVITIAAISLFTVIFLFSFRYISGATEIEADGIIDRGILETPHPSTELTPSPQGEGKSEIIDGVLDGEALEGEGAEQTNPSRESGGTEESLRAEEIKEYIRERIIPVVVGVLTSLSAVLASLGAIKKSLVRLSGARDDFKNEAKERKSEFERQSELLNRKAEELSQLAKLIPQLEGELMELKAAQEKLNEEAYNIGKMISLGFSGSQAVIKSGNGRKISALLSECRALSGKRDLEDEEDGENGEAGAEIPVSVAEEQSVRTRQKSDKRGE